VNMVCDFKKQRLHVWTVHVVGGVPKPTFPVATGLNQPFPEPHLNRTQGAEYFARYWETSGIANDVCAESFREVQFP
jgi:hypothetical protein